MNPLELIGHLAGKKRMTATLMFVGCLIWASPVGAQSTAAKQTDETKSTAAAKTEPPVTTDNSNWVNVKPTGGAAEFKMPIKPRYIERTFTPVDNEPPIKVNMHIGSFNNGTGAFVFSYHDMHRTPTTQLEIDNTLNGSVIGSIANVQGKPVSQQAIRYREYPGRAFVYLYAQGEQIYQVSARSFLVGNRQYQISALMKQDAFDEKIAAAFLDTFRILEPDEPEQSKGEPDGAPKSETKKPPESESSAQSESNPKTDSEKSPAEDETAGSADRNRN